MSLFNALIGATSTLGKNLIVYPTESNIIPGVDYVVYDTYDDTYKILKGKSYDENTFDFSRYQTNFDIVIGIRDNKIHAVACDDAYGYENMVNDDTAAAPCYYRLEFDNKQAGSLSYKITLLSSVIIENTLTWNGGDSYETIVEGLHSYLQSINTYAGAYVLDDNTGIGFSLGYYGNNTLEITESDVEYTLLDMSTLAVYDKGVKYGDSYNPNLAVINNNHKSWRSVSVQTIMGSDIIPIGPNTACIANNGQNYVYGCGINYAGYRSYMSANGNNQFCTDGVNGSKNTHSSTSYSNPYFPMNKSVFDSNINSSAAKDSDAYKMYEYYNNLLNSIGDEFAEKHDLYVSRYGEMEDLYAAYLMSHMINTDNPTSGIVYTSKDYGPELTNVKSKIFTVDYNYKYYPAYPPEYNALQYGLTDLQSGFGKGTYYHPEPYDIALIFRDDMLPKLNDNFKKSNFKVTKLTNSLYRGTSAEYNSYRTWYFGGARTLYANLRSDSVFRCRPFLAFDL